MLLPNTYAENGNIEGNFRRKRWSKSLWPWIRQRFLKYKTKSLSHKIKIDKSDSIKMKTLVFPNITLRQWRKKYSLGENICNSYIWQKTIYSIYEKLLEIKNKKTNSQILRVGKDLNKHFTKECTWMPEKHMKMCSMLLVVREMQIKVTMSYHYIPNRMAIIKKKDWWNLVLGNCGKRGILICCW